MKKKLLTFFAFVFTFSQSFSQLLSWTPDFIQESSTPIVITMDANYGNKGLLNYATTTDVYVHIGVITSLSATSSDWKYSKFTWGTANASAQATYLGNNKWSFTITGGLRTFFNITNSTETVKKIAILFRSGNGNTVQRNADGSDMYIPVYTTALAARFKTPFTQPTYVPRAEQITKNIGETISMQGIANQSSNMKLFLNGAQVASTNAVTSISASPTITTSGNQMLVVEATSGANVSRDTIQFFVAAPVVTEALPAGVKPGINYETDATAVTLCLYAPNKSRVSVIGDFPNSNWAEQTQYQMKRSPDGKYWWLRITGLTAGTEYSYQYLVNGGLKIGDPYCEKVQDPWNDQYIPSATYPGLKAYPTATSGIVSIFQTGQSAYNWQTTTYSRPDKRKLIIYELLLRDFLAKHDWTGLKDTLNYLQKLGVTAIEVMPFNEFEGNLSWGYNPDYYLAPDKYYGPANTLKQFVDQCHARGIAVVMDIALNHSFGLSPLVQLYWDSANNRPSPSNPWFNPVAKHAFNVGYDMNHESADTRYFVSRVVEHWLVNYKIDGFRFDLSKGFTQTKTCDDNGGSCNVGSWSNYDASRIAIWEQYYDTLQLKSPGSYAILEHFAANAEENELSNYGFLLWGNSNYNYSQAAMGYGSGNGWELRNNIFTERGWSQPNLITYMESHDEERIMYNLLNFGNASGSYNTKSLSTALKRMELCGAFLWTIPGPKMMWQFGELGYDYSINYCPNGTINSNCRTDAKPIRWDYQAVNDRKRVYDVWRALCDLRKNPIWSNLFTSNQLTYNLTPGFKYLIVTSGNQKMLVVGNFEVISQTSSVSMPALANTATDRWYDYFAQANTTISAAAHSETFTLAPGEYKVLLSAPQVIPVTLINFSGKRNGNINELTWKVNNEQNLSSYVVERSFDGANFQALGEVPAMAREEYGYSDNIQNVAGSVLYYRLKSVDVDGQFTYSSIIKMVRSQRGWIVEVRPNPFAEKMILQVESPVNDKLNVSITDLSGKQILSRQIAVSSGSNVFDIPEAASFPKGVYVVKITGQEFTQTMKLVKGN